MQRPASGHQTDVSIRNDMQLPAQQPEIKLLKLYLSKEPNILNQFKKKNNFNQEISRYIMKKAEKAKTFKSLIDLNDPTKQREFQLTYPIIDMESERGRAN